MTVLYCYYRYYAYYEEKLDSVDAAIWRALSDVDNTQASPYKIVLEDGTVLDQHEISAKVCEYAESVEDC